MRTHNLFDILVHYGKSEVISRIDDIRYGTEAKDVIVTSLLSKPKSDYDVSVVLSASIIRKEADYIHFNFSTRNLIDIGKNEIRLTRDGWKVSGIPGSRTNYTDTHPYSLISGELEIILEAWFPTKGNYEDLKKMVFYRKSGNYEEARDYLIPLVNSLEEFDIAKYDSEAKGSVASVIEAVTVGHRYELYQFSDEDEVTYEFIDARKSSARFLKYISLHPKIMYREFENSSLRNYRKSI